MEFDEQYIKDLPSDLIEIKNILEGGQKLENENKRLLDIISQNEVLTKKLKETEEKLATALEENIKAKPKKFRPIEDYDIINLNRFKRTNDKILEHPDIYTYDENLTAYDKVLREKQFTLNYNTEKKVELKFMDYQKNFIKNWSISSQEISILYYGVGSGKTLIAVNCAEQFQELNDNAFVYFLLPASLVLNTIKEMYKMGIDPTRKNKQGEYIYYFVSYQQMLRSNFDFKDTALLIVDEAHNLRNMYSVDINEKKSARRYEETGDYSLIGNKLSERLVNNKSKFMRTLMMTGTLFVNSPTDIEALLSIGYKKRPMIKYDYELYNNILNNDDLFKQYYQGLVSFFRVKDDDPRFPRTNYKFVPLFGEGELTPPIKDSFHLVGRNTYDKRKINYIIDFIKKHKNERTLIYSQFIEMSLDPLIEALNKLKIKYSYVTGSLNMIKKMEQVYLYNSGETNIMIFTLSIKEGISFSETDNFIFAQPYWNYAITEQVLARAIRLTSHSKGRQSTVNIEFLIGSSNSTKYNSGFQKLIKLYNHIMNNNIKKLDYDDLINNNDFKSLFQISDNKIKVSEEQRRGKRLKQRNNELDDIGFITKKNIELIGYFGSVDCLLFNKMFNKQNIINKFESRLLKLPSFEDVNNNENNAFIKDYNAFILGKEKKEKRQISIKEAKAIKKEMYKDYYNNEIKKINFIRISDDTNFKQNRNVNLEEKMDVRDYGNVEDKITNMINNNYSFGQILENFGVTKQEITQFQANFTPKNYCDLIIEKSGIKEDKRNKIMVLEPTAGIGNVIQSLLQVNNKENLFIDCNEFHKLFYNIGKTMFKDIDNVKWTNFNFVNYVNTYSYDYIIGNPPFNIPMIIDNQDVRWFDINFISKCFDLLDINGIICMIISDRFTRDNRFPFNKFNEYIKLFNEKSPGSITYEKIGGFKEDKRITKEMETSFGMVLIKIKKTEALSKFSIRLDKNISFDEINNKREGNNIPKFTKKKLNEMDKNKLLEIIELLKIDDDSDVNKEVSELADKIFEFQKNKQTTENNAMIMDKKESVVIDEPKIIDKDRKRRKLPPIEEKKEEKKKEDNDIFVFDDKTIFGVPKKKKKIILGDGIFDTVSSFVKDKIIEPVKDKIKDVFSIRKGYNNKSTRMLKKYGNLPINYAFIRRAPISRVLDKVINVISLGKWSKLKNKYSFDDMFHLQLVFNIKLENGNSKNILIEKNEVINIDDEYNTSKDSTEIKLDVKNNNLTINDVLEKTLKSIGEDKFFKYSAFSLNCQQFIRDVVKFGLNSLNKEVDNFIYQDISKIMEEMPDYVNKIAQGTTDFAAVLDKLIGRGNYGNEDDFKIHAVVIKKPIELEEAKKIASDIIKDKNRKFYRETKTSYRFRNIPKTKFKDYKTKKINKNVSIIFGNLK